MSSRRYSKILTVLGTSVILLVMVGTSAKAAAGDTTRVSVASDGTQANGDSSNQSISADGRFVAFASNATNLVSGDTNGGYDVFVNDQQTGTITMVSVASDGTQGNIGSGDSSISADGRFVAFFSSSTNLVSGDTNGIYDIFVHDQQSGQTTRVSVASDGTQANNESWFPSISTNGRYVTFVSRATNLVSGDTNGSYDVFVHDRQTGQTTRDSVASDGTEANNIDIINGQSGPPSISTDGRYVVFESSASNLVSGDTNNSEDIFVHDRQNGITEQVSVASDGMQGNDYSYRPKISADGRFVVFDSSATNLINGDTNGSNDVFVHDRLTGQTTLVSVASDGTQGNWNSREPSISDDGHYIAFASYATNLVSEHIYDSSDIFIHDQQTGETTRVSVASDGTQGNETSGLPSLSADGHYVTFFSYASNLVAGDTNGYLDIFVHENDVPVGPFLDLPFDYGGTVSGYLEALQNWDKENGRVNSWFDHKYPNYGYNDGTGIWLYNGKHTQNSYWAGKGVLCYDSFCYDGHNGIDFSYQDPQPDVPGDQPLSIHPSATGKVVKIKTGCVKGNFSSGCGGYGNYVVILHPNGYFTFYGHLASVNVTKVIEGQPISPADTLGIMGSTGNSTGTHLHFGVYLDNGNELWDGENIDKPVDPYGWTMSEDDPWVSSQGPISTRLWLYDPNQQISFQGNQGVIFTDLTNQVQVNIPPDLFTGQVIMELSIGPVAGTSAQLRSGGPSFLLKLLEGVVNGQKGNNILSGVSQLVLSQPISIAVNYSGSYRQHLDATQLSLYHRDDVQGMWQTLTTSLDTTNHIASAQTQELGSFDLQAPLVCPTDTLEPNDNYDGATYIQANGTLVSNLFDIATDEDWFKFDAAAGVTFNIHTANLADGVDTAMEIYDTDGLSMLASDDNSGGGNASKLIWQAPTDGTYFVRVKQADGSSYGCNSTYSIINVLIPTISGNAGVESAILSYTDSTPKMVIADGSGNYSFVVPYNWSGTVTPSKIGLTFSPFNRIYANIQTNQTGQDFTALVTISGNVGVSGVTLTYTVGGTAKSVISDAKGNYSIPVPYGWTGTVTPSKICGGRNSLTRCYFTPSQKSYTNVTVNQKLQNFTLKKVY